MSDATQKAESLMKRSAQKSPEDGSRAAHFAKIEREHGESLSDPKQRAMLSAREDGHRAGHLGKKP